MGRAAGVDCSAGGKPAARLSAAAATAAATLARSAGDDGAGEGGTLIMPAVVLWIRGKPSEPSLAGMDATAGEGMAADALEAAAGRIG